MLQGAATGLTTTASIAGVSYLYRDNLDLAIGIFKAQIGIGFSLGMLLSAAMHSLGGLSFCCFVMAGLAVLAGILVQLIIPKNIDEEKEDSASMSENTKRRV